MYYLCKVRNTIVDIIMDINKFIFILKYLFDEKLKVFIPENDTPIEFIIF